MDKKQRISDFINSLSEKESDSLLLPTASLIMGEGKNDKNCLNAIADCEGSTNGGDCINYKYCDSTSNKGSCKNYPDLEVNKNWYEGCAG